MLVHLAGVVKEAVLDLFTQISHGDAGQDPSGIFLLADCVRFVSCGWRLAWLGAKQRGM